METPIIPTDTETGGLTSLVYEPAEDSFLLLDALESDLPKSLERGNSSPEENILFILEVGSGSGIISTAVADSSSPILNGNIPCVFAADINPNASLLTQKTSEVNKVPGGSLHPLLFDGTSENNPFRIQFDVVLCNPPYVPIQKGENGEDEAAGLLRKSWDGGKDGNEFIIPFLKNVKEFLKKEGYLYLLLSSWNDPEMLKEEVAKPEGLEGVRIIKRACGRERLEVWRFQKIK